MGPPVNSILIKNGTVINADKTERADVLITGTTIAKVAAKIDATPDVEIIDATGKYVIPGGVDPHTHLDWEFMGTKTKDDFYHGTRAGIAGGTTMVIDFVVPVRGQSLLEAYDKWRLKADSKAVCDFSFHMGVTWWSKQVEKEMEELCKNRGVNSYKMFMAYKDTFMIDDADLFNVFKTCERLGALPMVHAENGHIINENSAVLFDNGITGPEGHQLARPENLEEEATNRACVIAENTGSSLYVVHVMSKPAASVIAKRRQLGNKRIFGEALAVGLAITFPKSTDFTVMAAHIMGPPIRDDPTTPSALMEFLAQDGLSTVGTDNCTFDTCQKELGRGDFNKIPNGVNGLEDRMSIVWNNGVRKGKITAQQFVAITSTNAAKIFNVYPKKGCIAAGSDADVIVWDGDMERIISAKTHHHNIDFNVYEGMKVVGNPEFVLVKGKICYNAHTKELSEEKGWGEYVPNPCFSPYVFTN